MKHIRKILALLLVVVMTMQVDTRVLAADFSTAQDGTYSVTADLSCHINAMGGVEFGRPLLKSAEVTIQSGSASLKLNFGKSNVTIYGVTCDTFIDSNEGTIGYYDQNGGLQTSGVAVTTSSDTVLNSKGEAVSYVTSMSFPLDRKSDTYQLSLYINSNVMGQQFDNGTYPANLTIDWSSVPEKVVTPPEENTDTAGNTGNAGNNESNMGENDTTNAGNGAASTEPNAGADQGAATNQTNTNPNNTANAGVTSNQGENADVADSNVTEETSQNAEMVEDVESEGTETVEAVEKDGLNIYYADNTEIEDVPDEKSTESNDGVERIIIGVGIALVAGAAGARYAVWKKNWKKNWKKKG